MIKNFKLSVLALGVFATLSLTSCGNEKQSKATEEAKTEQVAEKENACSGATTCSDDKADKSACPSEKQCAKECPKDGKACASEGAKSCTDKSKCGDKAECPKKKDCPKKKECPKDKSKCSDKKACDKSKCSSDKC